MATDRDIKRLLKKGLTGKEAARLIIEHSWERDRGREGFLSDGDFGRVKNSVRKPEDVDEYNKYIGAYRLVDYSLREAHILALEAQLILSKASQFLRDYYLEGFIQWRRHYTPAIMTQRQFEEESQAIRDRQRERKLRELKSLGEMLFERVFNERAPESWFDEWEQEMDDYTEEAFLKERYPEAWPQAAEDILELIRAGKLQPVQLFQKDMDKLEEIANRRAIARESFQARLRETGESWIDAVSEWEQEGETPPPPMEASLTASQWGAWNELIQEWDSLLEQAYERARKRAGQKSLARLVASLAKYRAGSLDERQAGRLLDYTFCLGEELYESGLPEWQGYIDTYYESYYEPELDENRIAIVQEPKPWDLDERGYFKENYLDWLEDLTQVKALDRLFQEEGKPGLLEFVQQTTEGAKRKVKAFLAYQAVISTVSEMIGVDFTEDLTEWHSSVEAYAGEYNGFARHSQGEDRFQFFPEGLKVPTLKVAMYKPTPGEVQYLRERMAMSLGPDWWEEVWVRTAAKEEADG